MSTAQHRHPRETIRLPGWGMVASLFVVGIVGPVCTLAEPVAEVIRSSPSPPVTVPVTVPDTDPGTDPSAW